MNGHNLSCLKTYLLFAFVVLLSACSLKPHEYTEPKFSTDAERRTFNLKVFNKAWELVDENFYDPTFGGRNWKAIGEQYRSEAEAAGNTDSLYDIINRMFAELNVSHLGAVKRSPFDLPLRPAPGMTLTYLEEQFVVSNVVSGGPADKAGVRKGWLVIARNGIPLTTENVGSADFKDGEPQTFIFVDSENREITASIIPKLTDFSLGNIPNPIEIRELEDDYLYIRIKNFVNGSVANLLREELEAYISASGVIFDMRANPGGDIYQQREALGLLFAEIKSMGNYVNRNGKREEIRSSKQTFSYDGPIAVLTDNTSGSGAEEFAHVVQFYKRGVIVGRNTAGAMLWSTQFGLPDGGTLQIPVKDYFGLDGKRLEGKGVQPDYEVSAPTLADLRSGRDRDIEVALQVLKEKN